MYSWPETTDRAENGLRFTMVNFTAVHRDVCDLAEPGNKLFEFQGTKEIEHHADI